MVSLDQAAIRVVDGLLPVSLCQELIAGFEQDKARATEIPSRLWELDIFEHSQPNPDHSFDSQRWKPLTDQIVELLIPQVNDYRVKWDPHGMLPPAFALEGLRVKKYQAGLHEFKLHVDVANRASSSRFIGCLFYLNDSDASTVFPDHGITVEALAGRLMLFPPTWQYPHQGQMPESHDKYIMSTYLHYGH